MTQVKKDKNKRYPLGFHVCCITYMFERLAYYGAKPILLLYLITAVADGGLGIDVADATVLVANLIAYTALAPIIGGIISDRWIGARYSVTLGLMLMAIGYSFGWRAEGVDMIHLMILFVSLGVGLFRGNLNAIIGCQFENQTMLDAAFTLQYSYINVGTFVGSLLTGFLYLHVFAKGDVLGFRPCFLVATGFCIIGCAWFTLNFGNLQGHGVKPHKNLDVDRKEKSLTAIERVHVLAIVIVAVLSIVFWVFYFQQDLALVIYMTDYVDMNIGGFTIPTSWITNSWNGLLCIILGGVMGKVWKRLAQRPQGELHIFYKIGWSFFFLSAAFGIMMFCEMMRGVGEGTNVKVSCMWPILFVTLITIGEMCFSPLRNSFVSKYAPKKYLSLLMGVIASSSFFANKLSPYVQVLISESDIFTVFKVICIVLAFIAVGILLLIKLRENFIFLKLI